MDPVVDECFDLSVIIATRNDDHGENPLERLQAMVDNLVCHARNLGARWELIIVEWNPPRDRPFLSQILSLPGPDCTLRVRIIRVSAAIHEGLKHSEKLPFFQMMAKNVGGRRARGKFLLFTNMDILFSESLAKWLAAKRPQKGRVYRIDRSDCDRISSEKMDAVQVLEWVKGHRIRHNGLIGTYPVGADGWRVENEIVKCAGVKLGLGWSRFHKTPLPQIFASPLVRLQVDGVALARGIALVVAPGSGVRYRSVSLDIGIHHPKKGCIFSAHNETGLGKHMIKIRIGEEKGSCEIRIATRGLDSPPALSQSHPWRLFAIEPLGENEIPLPSIQLHSVAWNDPFPNEKDIISGEGVSLLGDWHPVETNPEGIPSRWVGESPVVEVSLPNGCRGGWLTITAHPGPGVGARPFWLRAMEESDQTLLTAGVVGWRSIKIPVFSRDRDWVRVRLMAQPQGYRVGQESGDPRVLNFAVSRISWVPSMSGPGWLAWIAGGWDIAASARTMVSWALGKFRRKSLPLVEKETLPMVHMNNCGDFTLVDRDSFLASGGHSEETVFSLNLDTMFLYRLIAMGLKEEVLEPPLEIFHTEHGHGSGATPEGIDDLTRRIRDRGIPVIELDEVFDRARREFADPDLMAVKHPDWGFARETLPEETFGGAASS